MFQLMKDTDVIAESENHITYAEIQSGWQVDDHVFSDPQKIFTVRQTSIPLIGPIAFQMLFKVDELVAIDAAKETNPAIRIFWKMLDDPRTDFVDRNLEPVQTMLRNLEAEGLIGAGRAEEILHGSVSK